MLKNALNVWPGMEIFLLFWEMLKGFLLVMGILFIIIFFSSTHGYEILIHTSEFSVGEGWFISQGSCTKTL